MKEPQVELNLSEIPRVGVIDETQAKKPCKCFDMNEESMPMEEYTVIVGADEFRVGDWCDSIYEQKKMMNVQDDGSPAYIESLLSPYRIILENYGKEIASAYMQLLEKIIKNPQLIRDHCLEIDSQLYCQLYALDSFILDPDELEGITNKYLNILKNLNKVGDLRVQQSDFSKQTFDNTSPTVDKSSYLRAKHIENILVNDIFPRLDIALKMT